MAALYKHASESFHMLTKAHSSSTLGSCSIADESFNSCVALVKYSLENPAVSNLWDFLRNVREHQVEYIYGITLQLQLPAF